MKASYSSVDLAVLAKATPGFSGADLANMVNEAALLAARNNKTAVDQDDFEEAKDRVLMGPERRSMILLPEDKKITAVHEVGHALCAKMTPDSDPVHKITIIPRGRALGLTSILPGDEHKHQTRRRLKSYLVYMLGGRAAEEIVFGEFTTGAADDLRKATTLAHRMICEFGMSEHLGPRTFGEPDNQVFLGREIAHTRNFSDETARKIDEEVQSFIQEAHDTSLKILPACGCGCAVAVPMPRLCLCHACACAMPVLWLCLCHACAYATPVPVPCLCCGCAYATPVPVPCLCCGCAYATPVPMPCLCLRHACACATPVPPALLCQ